MCGIAGILARAGRKGLGDEAAPMGESLFLRGPDDAGVWSDDEAGIALAHRRLSVIDLTTQGHQPMPSATGRYVIAYNGEIYNYQTLVRRLEGEGAAPVWQGHSDTEALLAGFEAWGIEATLRAIDGMFAFALWDRSQRRLTLARDRFGEKPLYYGRTAGGDLLFGSELKALCAHPRFVRKVDPTARSLFARHGHVPAPWSIYVGTKKLTPGHSITFAANNETPVAEPYWSLADEATAGMADRFGGSFADAVDRMDDLFTDVVKSRMVADAPLGTFLSGGIDSSLATALMQKGAIAPVKAFTIGFADDAYDESKDAIAVARHLGVDQTVVTVTPEEARAVVPLLPDMYDEPFADSSQIPTHLVSKLARQSVTVALSGDGGDELFGGYNRHVAGPALWGRVGRLPIPLRGMLAAGIGILSPALWDKALAATGMRTPGLKMQKLADALLATDRIDLYRRLLSHWPVAVSDAMPTLPDAFEGGLTAEGMMWLDGVTYLPDDILTKVDRAAMSVSLETRAPFLSPALARFAYSLPLTMKVGEGGGKRIVKELLYRYVPQELVDRPKSGFALPVDRWLKNELRPWAEGLLFGEGGLRTDVVDSVELRRNWDEHQNGKRDRSERLWIALMYEAWAERWKPEESDG